MSESRLVYDAQDEPGYTESFEYMRDELVGLGAGGCAIRGTIAADNGSVQRAVYRYTERPPRVTQIVYTGHANLEATLYRVSVEEDAPVLEFGRYTYPIPDDPEEVYANVLARTPTATAPAAAAAAYFDTIYDNVFRFTPDPAN